MNEKNSTYYKMIGALADIALINVSGYFAYLFTYWPLDHAHLLHINLAQVLLINFIWFNVTQITRLYKDIFSKDAIPTIKQSIYSLLIFIAFTFGLGLLIPEYTVSNPMILRMLLLFAPLFLLSKIVFLLLRRSNRFKLMEYKRVVIVGAGPVGLELGKIMESRAGMGFRVVGFFDDRPELGKSGVSVLGGVGDCIDYVKRYNIKEVYCALPDSALDKINILMRQADQEMIRFKLVPDVKDYFKKNVKVKMLGHFPVISIRREPLDNTGNQLLKRIFDVGFSLLVMIFVMSWALPLLALLIKLESRGPVFFRQLRSGKDNKPFCCLKFRSMRVNGDADLLQARKNDSRITRIGAFMRKTSMDELPQFFNVLAGHMSVVGPRPHMLQHTEEYAVLIDQFMVRHFLLPGITGWAQVNGHRGETNEQGTMEARVEADIWYLENWSMLLDMKIVFLTGWQVFAGHDNAY